MAISFSDTCSSLLHQKWVNITFEKDSNYKIKFYLELKGICLPSEPIRFINYTSFVTFLWNCKVLPQAIIQKVLSPVNLVRQMAIAVLIADLLKHEYGKKLLYYFLKKICWQSFEKWWKSLSATTLNDKKLCRSFIDE